MDKQTKEAVIARLRELSGIIDNRLYDSYTKESLDKELSDIENLIQKVEEDNLKIYTADCGVCGSIVAITTSLDKAKELMKGEANYSKHDEIQESEIKEGLLFSNYGDL